jgi:hypothetical protein
MSMRPTVAIWGSLSQINTHPVRPERSEGASLDRFQLCVSSGELPYKLV